LFKGLKEPGPKTIFAPTDEAFSKLPSGTVGTLLDNPPELVKLLTYHIVAERLTSADLAKTNSVTTVEGSTLQIDASDGIKANDARVSTPDVEADNGIIQIVDAVLIPQSVSQLLVVS
jgi:uncharacterized surface protein with fasciclin (FAS1) repeats